MDTPLAATVHKKNVHVGGGKTFTMRKPIKLKLAGKRRKALADFRDTYPPSSGVSNDVDLKPMAHGKQQITWADLFTKQPFNWGISDEDFKEYHEWALEQDIDELDCSTWSIKEDEESYYKTYLDMNLLNRPFQSDDKGYEIDYPDLHSPMSFPGRHLNAREELDDFLDPSRLVLKEYPVPDLPEWKFEDDFGLNNDNRIGDKEREVCGQALLAELEKILANKLSAGEALKKKKQDDKSLCLL